MRDYFLHIKMKIAQGNLEEALEDLREFTKATPKVNNVVLQSARLTNLSKDIHDGVLRFEDIQVERNKITRSLLELIDEINLETSRNDGIKAEVDQFFASYQKLKAKEQRMSSSEKQWRFRHFDSYDYFIQGKTPEEKFHLQKSNSESYLKQFGLSIKILKQQLASLNYYGGEIDDTFTRELANSLEVFQFDNNMRHIDGFFGELTYHMIVLRLKELGEDFSTVKIL